MMAAYITNSINVKDLKMIRIRCFVRVILFLSISHISYPFYLQPPFIFTSLHSKGSMFARSPERDIDIDARTAKRVIFEKNPTETATLATTKSKSNRSNKSTKDKFDKIDKIFIEGGSLKTCSFDQEVERCTVFLMTGGSNLISEIELWQGPYNTPQKMTVYLQNGNESPFRATIQTPGGCNSVGIHNKAPLGFPMDTGIEVDRPSEFESNFEDSIQNEHFRVIQEGRTDVTTFTPNVQSLRVSLRTDGHPLHARVEILDGRKNIKQVMEIYTEDGSERPFDAIIETCGGKNKIGITNTAEADFPLFAHVEPYIVGGKNDVGSTNKNDNINKQQNATAPHESATKEELPIMEFNCIISDDEEEVYICEEFHP